MKIPIKHCKICFKILKSNSFYEFFNGDSCICDQCQNKLAPKFIRFDVEGIKGLAVYEYDDNIKSLLYQFKGCYDIELSPIFFNRFKRELKLMYSGYVIVPAPSYIEDDEKRGFKHVVEMFKIINLPIVEVFKKISPFKQAEHTRRSRAEISKHLEIVNKEKVNNKKVLIVDDVCTTGSTLKALIRLVREANPKDIKILVMSKRGQN